jgi:hypothetical protein
MKKRKMLSFCLIIGIALIFAPLTAHSTVLFSDFSPNDPPFDPQSGYTIMGSSNSLGWESSTQGPAFSFSGSASYKLTEVEVAAGLMNGTNSMNFYLMSDNNGVPGIVLVSFNTTALPDWGYPCVTTHLTFSGDLILYPNTTYWLIAEAGDPTTWAGFYWNTIGASGLVARSEGGNPWGPDDSGRHATNLSRGRRACQRPPTLRPSPFWTWPAGIIWLEEVQKGLRTLYT